MSSRSESVLNVLETYTYDNLDRLTSVTTGKIGQTGTTQTFSYHGNGNIENNSDVGDFYYGTNMSPPKPHAVTQIAPISERAISANQCAVTYNFFNQPTQITEGSYQFDLSYGANQQRNKVERSKNNVIENTRYYYSKYLEKEVDATAGTKHYYYIYGDNGVVGLYIDPRSVGTDTLYYIHTDHLGSYCAITTANVQAWMGEIENACGWQCRQAVRTWSCGGISADLIFCFFLIKQKEEEENMNGRLYDPVIARFFSPDKFVANSSFTQDFNRYSYARNCPLMYTDPDGEFFFLFPYVNWSKESGLNFGLNCIVGIPGIASAQFSVGVGPQTGLTATLGVTAAFTTAYVSIGTQSGLNVGWSFGLSPQIGLPFSSNITSFGINYNFKHGVLSGNLSAFCFDSNGKTSFNPSFSAAIAPEHFTNLVKGGGFRSNEQVFNRMMDRNSCQEILDYFGFKGKYDPEHALFKKWGLDHGITDPKTGKIYYSDGAFSKNYDYLALVAHHELFHSRNVKSGKFNGNYALEDWNTYMANYENQGLYPSQSSEIIRRIEGTGFASGIYGIGTEGYTNFSLQWWHFIYRIPRLW
jgi:RHS repeat-associated protein